MLEMKEMHLRCNDLERSRSLGHRKGMRGVERRTACCCYYYCFGAVPGGGDLALWVDGMTVWWEMVSRSRRCVGVGGDLRVARALGGMGESRGGLGFLRPCLWLHLHRHSAVRRGSPRVELIGLGLCGLTHSLSSALKLAGMIWV